MEFFVWFHTFYLFQIVSGHCKKLKPDWDKLMDEFNGSPGSLVADVDCTTEGQSLCEKHEATRHNGLITTDIISHHIPSYWITLESHGYFDREHAGRTIALELPVQRVCIEQLPLLRSRDTPQSSRVAAKKVGGMSTDLHVIHHVEIESWVIFDNISIQESWLFIFFHDKMLTCFKSILWTVRIFQLHFRSSSVMCFRMFCSGMESPVIWRRWKGKGEVRHPCPYPNIPLLLNKFITCRQLCLLSSNMLAHGPWHWNPKPVYSLLKRYEAVNAVRSFDVRCRCFLKSKATSGLKEKGELREPSWPLTGLSGWSRLQLLEEVCRRESGTVSWPSGFRLA